MTEDQLRSHFEKFGKVASAKIITDRETGRPKGFGFVEMPNVAEAEKAIAAINGKNVDGRPVVVNEARPRPFNGQGGQGGRGFDRRPRPT